MRTTRPYILFAVIWFIFSWPFFIRGLIPAPLDLLVNFFAPWDKYYDSPVINPAITDVVNQIIPWKTFTAWSLQNHSIPLWNPYNLAGTAHLGNWQSAVLYPTNLLFLVFPFLTAWSLHVLLQPLLAGVFMILYLRSLKLSWQASLLGGVAFAYSGFLTTWLEWGTLGHALLWLPLCLWAIERHLETQKVGYLAVSSIAVALSLLAGHLQISLYVMMIASLYWILRIWKARTFRLAPIVSTAYILIIPLLLAAAQILPTIQLYFNSYRAASVDAGWFMAFRMPFYGLASFLSPDFFGNPVTRNHWSDHSYIEMMGYVGVTPFILALSTLFTNLTLRNNFQRTFYWLLALFALLLSLRTPIANIPLWLKIPVFASSSPSRVIGVVSFALSVLAALGFERFFALRSDRKTSRPDNSIVVLLGVVTVIFVGMWGWVLMSGHPFAAVSARNFILPTALAIVTFVPLAGSSIFHELIPITSFALVRSLTKFARSLSPTHPDPRVGIGVALRRQQAHSASLSTSPTCSVRNLCTSFDKHVLLSALIILSVSDLYRFHRKFNPFTPSDYFYPTLPVISFLQQEPGRTFGLFDANLNLPFLVPTVEGYDPLVISDYVRYTSRAETGSPELPPRSSGVQLPKNGKATMEIISELGVSYVVEPTVHGGAPWELHLWEYPNQFQKIYEDSEYQVFENLNRKTPIEPFRSILTDQRRLFYAGLIISSTTALFLLVQAIKTASRRNE